ncbi:MAG: hypothetical protein P8Q42_03630 [Flavobacteriales bacterium]|nr:hypothetical protein [Flavobacteriales bacterium]
MKIKLAILNGYFFGMLSLGILFSFNYSEFVNDNAVYFYAITTTLPLFLFQFITISRFSRLVKSQNPKLFKEACKRPNGSQGSSINAAALFDTNIAFDKLKDKKTLNALILSKRIIIYSMLSFIAGLILFFL